MQRLKSILVLLSFTLLLFNCNKECQFDNDVCTETPPTDELCQAAFNRWFFDQESKVCEMRFYSGCSQKGFATESECQECECR